MKKIILLLPFIVLLSSCDLLQVERPGIMITEQEAVLGLKDALEQGATRSSLSLNQTDGYFSNPQVHIPWPEDAQKVANTLRDLGLGSEVDRVVLTLNRAAEEAAGKAAPIFASAIRQLTIRDAMDILFGPEDAATQYLRRTTSEQLRTEFEPVISTALDQVNATRYWGEVIGMYNQLPLVTPVDPDLENYVTERALDGLFYHIALEEQKIRENPVERTTAIMRRVFDYYDRNK